MITARRPAVRHRRRVGFGYGCDRADTDDLRGRYRRFGPRPAGRGRRALRVDLPVSQSGRCRRGGVSACSSMAITLSRPGRVMRRRRPSGGKMQHPRYGVPVAAGDGIQRRGNDLLHAGILLRCGPFALVPGRRHRGERDVAATWPCCAGSPTGTGGRAIAWASARMRASRPYLWHSHPSADERMTDGYCVTAATRS